MQREEAEAAKREPLGLRLHRDPPSIAPHFLEEVRKYLEKEYGSQRIYQGGLRVYTTLDPAMQRGRGPRAARRAPHARPPRARLRAAGGEPPRERAAAGAAPPRRVGLAVRRRRRGAGGRDRLRPRDRGRADRRVPRAALPRRRGVDAADERLRRPAPGRRGALPDRLALRDRRPEGGDGPAGAGAEGRGGAPRPRRALGGGARDGRRVRLREEQVQPGDAGHAPGGVRLQAGRLRRRPRDARAGPRPPSWWTPRSASRTPGTRRCGRPRTTTGRTRGRSRCAARSSRAGTSPR